MLLTAKNKTFLLVSILFTIFVLILVGAIYIKGTSKNPPQKLISTDPIK
jgi:hypothetical protein